MITRLRCLTALCVLLLPIIVRAQGVTSEPIDQALGRSGQKTGEVYKVSFPRGDLHVSVNGVAIKPGLALGSWAAFLGTDDKAMVMGDLVLLEAEVNPVVAKLRSSGFEISAVHNHLMEEAPKVLYVHYMAHGPAVQLATSLRSALSAYGVPRSNAITMGGMTIAPAAGVAQAINFQAADSGKVATTGDFVLTADEVNPVISELQGHEIAVTALHSHMLTEQPRLFFMHFWAVGNPDSVGAGIKSSAQPCC